MNGNTIKRPHLTYPTPCTTTNKDLQCNLWTTVHRMRTRGTKTSLNMVNKKFRSFQNNFSEKKFRYFCKNLLTIFFGCRPSLSFK